MFVFLLLFHSTVWFWPAWFSLAIPYYYYYFSLFHSFLLELSRAFGIPWSRIRMVFYSAIAI